MSPPDLKIESHDQYSPPTSLTLSSLSSSPLTQFTAWFTEAQSNPSITDPEAFVLSTCSSSGVPSSRVVLLRKVNAAGFTFFTNYTSRKGREIAQTGKAAMCFYWHAVNRQIRVVGSVSKVSREESAAYFSGRPLKSKIGAWISQQSQTLPSGTRKELEDAEEEFKKKHGIVDEDQEAEVPVPDFWGGYRIVPDEVEFWLGQPGRLHDRFRYTRLEGKDEWKIERLSP